LANKLCIVVTQAIVRVR